MSEKDPMQKKWVEELLEEWLEEWGKEAELESLILDFNKLYDSPVDDNE